jgi:hypothetical protein
MLAPVSAAAHSGAVPNRPCRRAYDHRLRDLVCEERDPALFPQLGIPRSTAASWIRRGSRDIVTTELFAENELALRERVLKLERRIRVLLGIVRLLFVMVRLFGLDLDSQRVPSGETKWRPRLSNRWPPPWTIGTCPFGRSPCTPSALAKCSRRPRPGAD